MLKAKCATQQKKLLLTVDPKKHSPKMTFSIITKKTEMSSDEELSCFCCHNSMVQNRT